MYYVTWMCLKQDRIIGVLLGCNENNKISIGGKNIIYKWGCENGFSTSLNNQVFKNNKIYINWNTFNENYSKLIKNIESENYERIYDLIRTCTKNIEVM